MSRTDTMTVAHTAELASTSAAGRLRRVARWALGGAVLALLIAVPWISGFASQRLFVEVFTVFAMALAWNLLAGYGGMVAVGQHAFIGVGAYALFVASNASGISPWFALPAAVLGSVVLACVSAWPMFRLNGPYFAVGTWVIAEVLRIVALNTSALGAGGGLPLEAAMTLDRWTRNAGVYWSALGVALGSLLAARSVLRGRLGLALRSVADAPDAAAASGVRVGRVKLALWCIAAAISGAAGGVAYMGTMQVTPDASFSLNWTAAAIFVAVLGGVGTLEGPLIGTCLYFLLRELFADQGAWYFIGLGALAMATMVVAPGGAWSLIGRRWSIDPFGVRRRMPRG